MSKKTVFIDTIPDKTITLKKGDDLTIVGLINKGWAGTRRFNINASGRESKCDCVIFILGTDSHSFSAKIKAAHRAPDTKIRTRMRTILAGKSSCGIEAVWDIEKNARGADAYFSHHTLLLSENAAIKTSPYLEIKTDDLKAGHAASVGKIDENALFYLLSRGLSEKQARVLLTQGFFEIELSAIENENIKNKARQKINKFLSKKYAA